MNHRASKGPFRDFLSRYPQLISYILFALGVIVAFSLFAYNNAQDQRLRCQGGVETRNVQRTLVDAIANLAVTATEKPPGTRPYSELELDRVNEYRQGIQDFRVEAYAMIRPSEPCAPFVNDDVVAPPPPPIAPITNAD